MRSISAIKAGASPLLNVPQSFCKVCARTLGGVQLPPPITSRTNARVKALRAAFEGKASRPGEFIAIEGATLILEALRSGARIETLFVREGSEAVLQSELSELSASPIAVLSTDVFASAVDTASPQGVAATMEIPRIDEAPNRRPDQLEYPVTLVL